MLPTPDPKLILRGTPDIVRLSQERKEALMSGATHWSGTITHLAEGPAVSELTRLNRLDARQRAALSKQTRKELAILFDHWDAYYQLTSLSDAEWEAAVSGELSLSDHEDITRVISPY